MLFLLNTLSKKTNLGECTAAGCQHSCICSFWLKKVKLWLIYG